jgi:hypothetical protein
MAKKAPKPIPDFKPDLVKYFQTVRAELDAVKDRIRSLVRHWPTDGTHKEAALRSVLRRHLPASLELARGFIVGTKGSSTEIDLMVIDRACPTLFKDEGVVIVSPHFVRAIIEVKTELSSMAKVQKAIKKLADNATLCVGSGGYRTWAGLFVYEGDWRQYDEMLSRLGRAWERGRVPVDGVAFGPNLLVRHVEGRFFNLKDKDHVWCAFKTPQLSPSYFMASMMEDLDLIPHMDKRLWFPSQKGNRWLNYLAFGSRDIKKMPKPKPRKPKGGTKP